MSENETVAFWEQRYAAGERVWSGKPNAALVDLAGDLTPGRALDLGCGEGGDSVWLAARGWQVTAVDVAATAVTRGRQLADQSGAIEGSIEWIVADLTTWQPSGIYQLVSACFLQSPLDFPRTEVLRRVAATVTGGGHLLLVAHAEAPPWAANPERSHHHFVDPTVEIATLALDPQEWDVVVGETRRRPATGPNGEASSLLDSVVLFGRR